jgi:hypothetical protein
MPIKADCSCGHTFNAPSKYAGKKVKCPKCKEPLTITAAKQASSPAKQASSPAKQASSPTSGKASKIAVTCKCGKAFQAKLELAGKRVKCPACGDPITIKPPKSATLATTKKSTAAAKPVKQESMMSEMFDEIGFAMEEGGGVGRKCPECKSPMAAEAILCIDCGYNENLGKKMKVVRPVTATDRAKKASK